MTSEPLWLLSAQAGWVTAPVLHILALVGCGLAVLAASALWIYLLLLGWRWLQRKFAQTLALKLSSQGNLAMPFQLRVELNGLEKKVRLVWLQDGEPLKFTTIQKTTYVDEVLPASQPKGKPAQKAKPAKKNALGQEYQKVNKFANLLASIASTLAALLPGPLKGPLASFAGTIRKEQAALGQVKADKDRVTSSARMLDSNVKQLGNAAGKKKTVKPRAQESAEVSTGLPEGLSRRLIAQEIPVVFTRPLEPRESSQCKLVILPRAPFRGLSGDLLICALPVEQKESPAYGVLQDQALPGKVEIKAPAFIYPAVYGLFGLASLAVNAAWCLRLVQWLVTVW